MSADVYSIVVASGAGLIFGSFATAVAYRVPRHESIVTGRSRCPYCGAEIRWFENIPLFGYLFLRGRCARCGVRISPRYPLIELATAVLFGLLVYRFGATATVVLYGAFFWVLVVLTAIDLEHKLLPNRIVYPALTVGWLGLAALATADGEPERLLDGAAGALAFGGFLFVVAFIAPAGMGGGDVKLGVLLGTFLGYSGGLGVALVGMFLSFLLGGLIGVALLLRGAGRKTEVPFGPFLAGGSVIAILCGRSILDWYLG